jgi:hypothetical protein
MGWLLDGMVTIFIRRLSYRKINSGERRPGFQVMAQNFVELIRENNPEARRHNSTSAQAALIQ